jgi:hypothetical protein
MALQTTSTPNVTEFKPLPGQLKVIKDVRRNFDYDKGVQEVLLSGSVGSAKSILVAHLAVTHGVLYPGSNFGIGRLTLPSLKQTLSLKIREHLFGSGIDHKYNQTMGSFTLPNRSKITAFSWSDKNYQKVRSYELSGLAIEELSENKDPEIYHELYARVGRLPHVPESLIICPTNPDSPGHWAYKHFIATENPNRHVYYSRTDENPYLPPSYIENLKEIYDERMFRRMVGGEWLEIAQDVVYYAYDRQNNYRHESYRVNPSVPIHITWDFNIGLGKPLSLTLFQKIGDTFHFFNEIVVEGQRTGDSLDELYERGHLEHNALYYLNGDATAKARDTRSKRSDYDIIDNFFANTRTKKGRRINYKLDVPLSNPPIRTRHNIVNGVIKNAKGQVNVVVYKDCPTLDEGFRLTKLKTGSQYQEDDSDRWQHITTAAGYGIVSTLRRENKKPVQMLKRI